MLGVGAGLRGGVAEGLGFDGPHHQRAAGQRGAGGFLGGDAELLLQAFAGLGPGLDDLDAAGVQALVDQAANDGAGHVAAADEGDGGVGGCGFGCGAHGFTR